MESPVFVPHEPYRPAGSPLQAAQDFRDVLLQRRSVRDFSPEPVDRALIEAVVHGQDAVDGHLMKRVLRAHPLYAATRSA